MKKMSIYQHSSTNLHDITPADLPNIYDIILTDLNSDQVELFSIKGLVSSEALKTINNLIQKYDMQLNDKIVNYHFDENKNLKETVRFTVDEYLQS
ncbi:hypothetical protein [Bacillus infantis]|uniref:hypothetical protein n=1 Tax=Bacillus infantis TaxID=324767 RepID=UPI003CF5E041